MSALNGIALLKQRINERKPRLPDAPVIDRAGDASAARLASERARAFASGSEGRQGTLLTGPMGVTSPVPTKKKTLLGE